jgi:hypothetical protein
MFKVVGNVRASSEKQGPDPPADDRETSQNGDNTPHGQEGTWDAQLCLSTRLSEKGEHRQAPHVNSSENRCDRADEINPHGTRSLASHPQDSSLEKKAVTNGNPE